VRRTAAAEPDCAVIGVDAAAAGLRETSRRLAAKPARGGLPNALCGRMALADAPGELAGLADRLTVLLPWGELLAAVARPDAGGLARLRGLCREGAELRVVFGHGPEAEAAAVRDLALPELTDANLAMLERRYREAGFEARARWMALEAVRALPTTWAKRLAFSGRARTFVEVRGRAMAAPAPAG